MNERVFGETGGNEHVSLLTLDEGSYSIFVRCQDSASNEARKQTDIVVRIDRFPPVIIRIFRSGSNLVLITDEISSCRYHERDFNFEDGITMEPDNDDTHVAPLSELPIVMNVRCRDVFGNELHQIVRPFSF